MDKELEDFLDEYSKIICALINAFKDYIYSLRSFINSIIIIICWEQLQKIQKREFSEQWKE